MEKFKPHWFQGEFLDSDSRYKALISGVGGGKTIVGCVQALKYAENFKGSTGAIVAPTFPMQRDVTMRTFFEICPPEAIDSINRGDSLVRLCNGSEIWFRSAAEPERLRGPNLGWFWIDEAALVGEKVWNIMVGRLRRQPERGFITTTPKGYNWVWKYFVDLPSKRPELKKDYWYVSFATDENLYLSDSYVSSLTETYSGAFLKQEFYGEFVGFEDVVYPMFNRQRHVIDTTPQTTRYYAACDFGYTNPSVFLVVGVDSDDNIYVLEEFYQSQVQIEDYVKYAREMYQKYKLSVCYCDPSSPEYISALNKANVPARGVNREVMDGILAVSNCLSDAGKKPKLYVHQRCVNTIMEFENYRYPEKSNEKPVRELPIKIHDHAMDALSYVCYELRRTSIPLLLGNLSELTKH